MELGPVAHHQHHPLTRPQPSGQQPGRHTGDLVTQLPIRHFLHPPAPSPTIRRKGNNSRVRRSRAHERLRQRVTRYHGVDLGRLDSVIANSQAIFLRGQHSRTPSPSRSNAGRRPEPPINHSTQTPNTSTESRVAPGDGRSERNDGTASRGASAVFDSHAGRRGTQTGSPLSAGRTSPKIGRGSTAYGLAATWRISVAASMYTANLTTRPPANSNREQPVKSTRLPVGANPRIRRDGSPEAATEPRPPLVGYHVYDLALDVGECRSRRLVRSLHASTTAVVRSFLRTTTRGRANEVPAKSRSWALMRSFMRSNASR